MRVLVLYMVLPFVCSQYYEYLNFTVLASHLITLKEKYPDLIKVETAYERFNLPSPDCNSDECPIYIVTLTHFKSLTSTRPQVFISGALHGNEVLGPNIVIYLLEHLLENYEKDNWITYLINNRQLVAMPVPNSQGYFYNRRQEMYKGEYYDPNRDFPYDNNSSNCLNTLTGRSIVRTITDHMFIIGITFHGGDYAISYPWGSINHAVKSKGEEAPDDEAMRGVAEMLSRVAGITPAPYAVGKVTDILYPVKGGLEDWAYAASWAKTIERDAFVEECTNEIKANDNASKIIINEHNVRFPLYLIETANSKWPSKELWGRKENYSESTLGHIPRNIRVSMALMDMAEPYIRDVEINYYDERFAELTWKVGGSLHVNETYVEVNTYCKTILETEFIWLNNSKLIDNCMNISYKSNVQSGPGYWTDSKSTFNALIPLSLLINISYSFRIAAIVDQQWSIQSDPKPNIPPVTHFTRMRIEDNYYANSSTSVIKTNKVYYSPSFRPNELPEGVKIVNKRDFFIALIGAIMIIVSVGFCFKLCLWWRDRQYNQLVSQSYITANTEVPGIQLREI